MLLERRLLGKCPLGQNPCPDPKHVRLQHSDSEGWGPYRGDATTCQMLARGTDGRNHPVCDPLKCSKQDYSRPSCRHFAQNFYPALCRWRTAKRLPIDSAPRRPECLTATCQTALLLHKCQGRTFNLRLLPRIPSSPPEGGACRDHCGGRSCLAGRQGMRMVTRSEDKGKSGPFGGIPRF